jgi:hypothetical protein
LYILGVGKLMARPSDYTPELGLLICQRMVEGETLRKTGVDRYR